MSYRSFVYMNCDARVRVSTTVTSVQTLRLMAFGATAANVIGPLLAYRAREIGTIDSKGAPRVSSMMDAIVEVVRVPSILRAVRMTTPEMVIAWAASALIMSLRQAGVSWCSNQSQDKKMIATPSMRNAEVTQKRIHELRRLRGTSASRCSGIGVAY